jgi:small subunit ribosomal protein S3
MGQKVHPTSFRIGLLETWRSRWYADKKNFGLMLVEDQKLRNYIKKNYKFAGIPKIEIERTRDQVHVTLHTARPGIIIGRRGAEVDKLRDELSSLTGRDVTINIKEVPKPELDAQLVAEDISEQLVKRSPVRRMMKKACDTAMQMGAEGVKVIVSGRLGGAEMARREQQKAGRVPLHTLLADIDYGTATAVTTYGALGVKVWIYKGKRIGEKEQRHAPDAQASRASQEPEAQGQR